MTPFVLLRTSPPRASSKHFPTDKTLPTVQGGGGGLNPSVRTETPFGVLPWWDKQKQSVLGYIHTYLPLRDC